MVDFYICGATRETVVIRESDEYGDVRSVSFSDKPSWYIEGYSDLYDILLEAIQRNLV